MIEIDEVKGRKLSLKVSGKNFYKDLNFIKKEMIGRKYNEATKKWEIPILKTNFKRLQDAKDSFADTDALWAFEEEDYETYLTAEKDEDKIIVNVYQDKEILNLLKKHRKKGDRTITLENQINQVIFEITKLEGDTKMMMEEKVKDWTEQFQQLKEEATRQLKNQIYDIQDDFENTKKLISTQLGKLELDVLQKSVVVLVEQSLDKKLNEVIDKLNIEMNAGQKGFSKDLKKITEHLETEFIHDLSSEIGIILNKWDKKKWSLSETTWNAVKDDITELLTKREEKFEINC